MDDERPLTGGEVWARDALAALLARRFSPPAVVEFLWASWRRSAAVRRARPRLARQAWTWAAVGAAGQVVVARGDRRRLRDGLAWWTVVALMLDWHLGMLETEDGRPRDLAAADALTLARAWLVPVARHDPAPGVVAVAAVTDVLDGVLARRVGPTRAGRDLEGLVDTCFAVAALRGALEQRRIGRRAAAAELMRLTVGAAYATAVWFGRAAPPSRAVLGAGRATTTLRVGGLVAATSGRRRTGEALLVGGSAASLALAARAVVHGRRDARG